MSFVRIPVGAISPEALAALVREFVIRDGTDYGVVECTLQEKMRDVMRQLEHGDVVIVFEGESETFTIVPRKAR